MTPHDFIAKWSRVELSERSACQQHFLDLCEVLEQPKPAAASWTRYVHRPNAAAIGTVRYPRLVPKDEDCAKELEKRTLTNL